MVIAYMLQIAKTRIRWGGKLRPFNTQCISSTLLRRLECHEYSTQCQCSLQNNLETIPRMYWDKKKKLLIAY